MTTAPPASITAGGSGTFEIQFVVGEGAFSLDMDLGNNDANEDPYDIYINGIGVLPEMNLKQGVTDIEPNKRNFQIQPPVTKNDD